MSERSCGDCRACCTVLGVRDVAPEPKPAFQRCAHECEAGCAIYDTRPHTCRVYRCAWLDGMDDESSRPDLLGVILDCAAPSLAAQQLAEQGDAGGKRAVEQARNTIHAREVRHGAFNEPRVANGLGRLVRNGKLVVLVPFKGRKLAVGVAL